MRSQLDVVVRGSCSIAFDYGWSSQSLIQTKDVCAGCTYEGRQVLLVRSDLRAVVKMIHRGTVAVVVKGGLREPQ